MLHLLIELGYRFAGNEGVYADDDAVLEYMRNMWYDAKIGKGLVLFLTLIQVFEEQV